MANEVHAYVQQAEAAQVHERNGDWFEAAEDWMQAAKLCGGELAEPMYARAEECARKGESGAKGSAKVRTPIPGTVHLAGRDDRLPVAGTIAVKEFRNGGFVRVRFNEGSSVTVIDSDKKELTDQTFYSVSGLGHAYTGRNINGFDWLGLPVEGEDITAPAPPRLASLCRKASAVLAELANEIDKATRFKAMAILLMAALVGCSQQEIPAATGTSHAVYPIAIDTIKDHNGMSGVDFAADLFGGSAGWNVVNDGYLADSEQSIYRFSCTDESIAPFIAFTTKAGIKVDCALLAAYPQEHREKILMHEMGHFMGLEHVLEPTSVMYAQFEPGGPVADQYDIAEYKRIHPEVMP